MVLLGLLTLLSLLSGSNGWLSSGWLAIIGKSFGWGMYLLPVGLMALGLWLILRHFEQLPQMEPVRVVGLFLFFILLLAWLHLFSFPENQAEIFNLAAQSQGGGYLGGVLVALLQPNFGREGAVITLAGRHLDRPGFLPGFISAGTVQLAGSYFSERLRKSWDQLSNQVTTKISQTNPSAAY